MAQIKDLTEKRFGRLQVIRKTDQRKNRNVVWECRCDCGELVFVPSVDLTAGRKRSCGCMRNEFVDLTGRRFGKLEALRPTEERKNSRVVWECRCDCGNTVRVSSLNLLQGYTQSCGCLYRETKCVDLTGKRYGRLVAIRPTEERRNGYVVWECQCDCGGIIRVRSSSLLQGNTQSCGCIQKAPRTASNDLTGMRFGRFTVLRDSGRRQNYQILWDCQCDCGNQKTVNGYSLTHGKSRSCGCLRRETSAQINKLNLTGQRFGKLTARREAGVQKKNLLWECECDCGNVVNVFRSNLVSGNTTSCGKCGGLRL